MWRLSLGQAGSLEAGGDDRDLHLVAQRFVGHDTEVDLHILDARGVADQLAGLVHVVQREVARRR